MPTVTLKVAEAFQNDIGRNIIRIDSKAKSELGVSTGDTVKLSGKKAALAIVWQAHPDDEGLDMVRMDGILRQNAGVGLGDRVKLEVMEAKEARKVVLTPREPMRYSPGFDQYVKKRLVGKPILKGNLIPVGVFGTSIPLIVTQAFPQGGVMVTDGTELIIKTEPVKDIGNVPNITYDDIGGMKDTIPKIREMVELPLRHPEIFEKLGIEPPKGVLLYGPPGTGKTLLVKAVANESDANFHYVGGPEIISKYVGESEEKIRKLFKEAEENSPSIIFIDEIDAIAPKREEVVGEVERRIVSQLLTLMDGLKARGEVIVIGASVTGDTPVLLKTQNGIKLMQISKFVDSFYVPGEADLEKKVEGVFALGFDSCGAKNNQDFKYFGNSAFKSVRGVFRHRVKKIYEIHYNGGIIKATGSHSVFIRTRQGLIEKPVSKLKPGDILVEIPFKVQRSDGELPLIRSHIFPKLEDFRLELPVSDLAALRNAYACAQASSTMYEYSEIASSRGVSISTVQHWHGGLSAPKLLQTPLATNLPDCVSATPDLACLLGYYTAEGYARKELDFCFGTHEKEYHADLQEKMRAIFGAEPKVIVTGSRTNIVYQSKLLADFFVAQCGKGAHNKHVPAWLFEAPRELFLAFLYGYLRGDGCRLKGRKKGYQATSVSKQLIVELNWLCRMHGIKTSITSFTAKAGREILGQRIEKATKAWRLLIGSSSDPFAITSEKHRNIKRPIIREIKHLPFDGYVYDLCGCENEAFFGGESPVLLHNTNRPNSIDPALRRPGRFDREIELGVPDIQGRREILQIHVRNMPLDKSVNIDEFARLTHGYTGADISSLTKEAAIKALRRILPEINLEQEFIPPELLENLKVTRKDFESALREIQPSALREVFVERPDVKWADIGGMEMIKQEIQEAVELPLKKPDIFENMGIRPVKGILLYGPPGTGKTLLAKAVANESEANFISISGAQVLSKWVGESLAYDEEIILFGEDAIPQRVAIGEYIDSIIGSNEQGSGNKRQIASVELNQSTISFNDSGKVVFGKVIDVLRHPFIGNEIYEVETKIGRRIRLTADHGLFTLRGSEIAETKTSELIAGESFVAIPKKLELPERHVSKISLEKLVEHPYHKSGNGRVWVVNRPDVSLSLELEMSPEFAYIIGLWLAEGDYNRGVRIHNQNPWIREKLRACASKLGMPLFECKKFALISSSLWRRVFEEIFGLKSGAYNKRFPAFAFALPRKVLAEMLNGYFSGDGSVHGNLHRYYVEATTVSEKMADDIMNLLLYFGIVAIKYTKLEKRYAHDKYVVQFSGVDNFRKFLEINFADAPRAERVSDYITSKRWTRTNQIPMTEEIRNFLLRNGKSEWAKSDSVGSRILKDALEGSTVGKNSPFWRLISSDIYWDKVVSIKRVKYDKPYVYDLSIEATERFFASGFFVHNSEKAVRELFRRARMCAPCIVFIDEVDAIAPSRGGEEGHRVTERVVDTLLTELDGLKSLKHVVVIAATNRPDMLDPALMRSGRFDRSIEVGLPDEKARLQIFKVHTKKMPIDPLLKIEELARLTAGYTGADIENLCREAGMFAIREGAKKVVSKHFAAAMKTIMPTIRREDMESVEKFKSMSNTMYR